MPNDKPEKLSSMLATCRLSLGVRAEAIARGRREGKNEAESFATICHKVLLKLARLAFLSNARESSIHAGLQDI